MKFIGKDRVLLCSNNEYIKLLDLNTGDMELYGGHSDIILCLDISKPQADDSSIFLTGGKDSDIRMWKYMPDAPF